MKAFIIGCSKDQEEESVVNKIHGCIALRMKRKSILSITPEGSFKVKRRTILYNTQSHVQDQQEIENAPPTLEDRGKTTLDELQEIYKITNGDDARINPIDGRFQVLLHMKFKIAP